MIASLTAAALTAPAFGYIAPWLARRVQPPTATWLLAVGGLVAAFTSGTALAMLAFLLLSRSPELTRYWGWSHSTLERDNDVPMVVSLLALSALILSVVRAVTTAAARAQAVRRCYVLAASLGPTDLIVTADNTTPAVALPGRPGKVVLSQRLLTRLDPATRRVVIAHEQAHLRHRHHWAMSAGVVAAAANPFLKPVRQALELSTERWADEAAGSVTGRRTVASAIVRFGEALADRPSEPGDILSAPSAESSVGAGCARQRVLALLSPPVRGLSWRLWVLIALTVAPNLVFIWSWWNVERLYELAQADFILGR